VHNGTKGVSGDVSFQADVPCAESNRDSSMAGDWPPTMHMNGVHSQVIGNSTHDEVFNGSNGHILQCRG